MKTPEECIEKLKAMPFEEGLNEALQLRSDDFGHNCHTLLVAESFCLQYFGEQFLDKLKAERERAQGLLSALEFYGNYENYFIYAKEIKAGDMVLMVFDTTNIKEDEGKRAREARAKYKEKECGVSKKETCTACGDYDGNRKGEVWVECCSRCNELQYIGQCKTCNGTGFIVDASKTNFQMIRDACEASNGYLCGMGDK